ncbi:DNA-binding protein [Mucilaginibacter conchicola]|uniref:DNA-binding protein n=1 Tax=Mucilaginibacter conchicola TaxID=2303333 RepID=A0A372P0J4_9SPHI|nr:DNA-binding protein [Mucilaginibacter conchicola]RFZ95429.1 DNA-binding protein [Mucilaginibacter conchicola]
MSSKEIYPIPKISAPASRALVAAGLHTLNDIAGLTQKQFMQLHGMGKHGLRIVKEAMDLAGLQFKDSSNQ